MARAFLRMPLIIGFLVALSSPNGGAQEKKDPCPDRNNCPPPGTCTSSRLSSMQSAKDSACNRSRSCQQPSASSKADCGEYKEFIQRNEECIQKRNDIMSECFKGGNDSHRDERDNVVRVLNDCKKALSNAQSMNVCK
jgi:hypothetical protein